MTAAYWRRKSKITYLERQIAEAEQKLLSWAVINLRDNEHVIRLEELHLDLEDAKADLAALLRIKP